VWVCVCVCVCVWGRERERERVRVCVCERERESVCVCVCERERERGEWESGSPAERLTAARARRFVLAGEANTVILSLPLSPPPPSLPYKVDTSRPALRTNWTRLVPVPPVSQTYPCLHRQCLIWYLICHRTPLSEL